MDTGASRVLDLFSQELQEQLSFIQLEGLNSLQLESYKNTSSSELLLYSNFFHFVVTIISPLYISFFNFS